MLNTIWLLNDDWLPHFSDGGGGGGVLHIRGGSVGGGTGRLKETRGSGGGYQGVLNEEQECGCVWLRRKAFALCAYHKKENVH